MGNELKCVRPSYDKAPRLPHNRFKVRNVNDQGRIVNKGYLEVTRTELILYVLNAEPVRWPLRCLRRYGYDANLFSFESGRRCATGPGIYAFKSKYASQIFQLVQENAQRPEENGNGTNGVAPGTAPAENTASTAVSVGSIASTMPTSMTMRQRSLSSEMSLPASHVVSRSSSHNSGINGLNGSVQPRAAIGATISRVPLIPTSASPVYFNGTSSLPRVSPVSPTSQYVNTAGFSEIPESPLENSPSQVAMANGTSHRPLTSSESFGDPSLNYAWLKLPTDEEKTNTEEQQEGEGKAGVKKEELKKEKEEEAEGTDGWKGRLAEMDGEKDKMEENSGRVEEEMTKEKDCLKTPELAKDASVNMDQEPTSSSSESNSPSDDDPVSVDSQVEQSTKVDGCKEQWVICESGIANGGSPDESDANSDKSDVHGSSKGEVSVEDTVEPLIDFSDVAIVESTKSEKRESPPRNGKVRKLKVSDVERNALFQDVVNGNIRPEKLKDRSGGTILVNYANWPENQLQEVLNKLETSGRNENISPCTVCSNSSGNASQRVSPLSYYANLDTAGELPPNWQANGFYPELRTPRSAASSKGSVGSEFTFEVTNHHRGSCSPVDHNYANLDTLPEVHQPIRAGGGSIPGSSGGSWMILQPPPKGKMNYIELEFDENDQPIFHDHHLSHHHVHGHHTMPPPLKRSISSSASSTPPKTPVSPQQELAKAAMGGASDIYARIDIEKTVALANSHRHVEGDTDISTRRTRHDVWTSK